MKIKDKFKKVPGMGTKNIPTMVLKDLIVSQEIHEKLSDCIIEMITSTKMPYYGEFTQAINFTQAQIPTCGVNVTDKGMNFYWGKEFIENCNRKEVLFTIIHEVFHLIFDHHKRGMGYDKKISNLAADMIINSIIHGEMMIAENLTNVIEIPKDELGNNTCVFLSKDYRGAPIFEDVYFWLMDQYNDWRNKNSDKLDKQAKVDKDGNVTINGQKYCGKCGQKIDGKDGKDGKDGQESDKEGQGSGKDCCDKCGQEKQDGQGSGQGQGEGEPQDGQGQSSGYGNNGQSGDKRENDVDMYPVERFFENIEYNKGQSFDIHFDDDVPEAVRKQWVNSQIEKLKARGLESGSVEKILNKLQKTEKDYLKEIKRTISNDIFGSKKQKSITKLNRRGIEGLKGQRKYKTRINCLLDTSGSMSGDFEKVLSYIFQNDIEINLIQVDTQIQEVLHIKRKRDLEKMKIHGLGGTTLTPGLQYIVADKKLNKLNTVILTDGYTDSLDITGIKGKILVLSTNTECPLVYNSSKIKQIIIDKSK